MGLPTPGTNNLQVLRAVEEGWQAFCRAPWPFLLFQALVLVITVPCVLLAMAGALRLGGGEPTALPPALAAIALVGGVVGAVLATLWGVVGLNRGAWLCLDGQRPVFRTFTRWDGAAAGRLLLSKLLLVVVLVLAGVLAMLLGSGLGNLNTALATLPLLVFAIFYIWLLVNQKFLIQLSLFGVRRPLETLQAGVAGVNPSWWVVLWLVIVESVIHAIAMLFSYGGLFVIVPVMVCIGAAAYRQLFGCQDHTGLLREPQS